MTSNPNLELLMNKIFDNAEIVEEIMATDDMSDLYKICLTIQDGYTFEEFNEFFDSLVYTCMDEIKGAKDAAESNGDQIKKLDVDQLTEISGGANGAQRVAATTLALLSFMAPTKIYGKTTGGKSPTIHGAPLIINKNIDLSKAPLKPEIKEEQKKKKTSIGSSIGAYLGNFLDNVWENKGKLLLFGSLLLGGGALLEYSHEKIGENITKAIQNYQSKKGLNDLTSKTAKLMVDYDKYSGIQKLGEPVRGKDESQESFDARKKSYADACEFVKNNQKDYEQALSSTKSFKDTMDALNTQSVWDTLTGGLPFITGVGMLAGGAGAALVKAKDAIAYVSDLIKHATTIGNNYEAAQAKLKAWESDKKLKEQIKAQENYDGDEAREYLEYMFENFIHGQDAAKEQIMSFFVNFVADLKAAQKGYTSHNLPDPKIYVFNGPSGTGKTYMAELLSQAMTKIDAYKLTANNIISASKDMYMKDIVSGMLYGNTQKNEENKDVLFWGHSSDNLTGFLKKTEKTIRVVILDEWDKLYRKDETGKYPQAHPLDETFRDIIDGSLKDEYGHVIDLHGVIFICTTNETVASLQGRIRLDGSQLVEALVDEEGDPVLDDYGDQVYGKPTVDSSGTQTLVPHDGSLMARLAGNICYFDKLESDDYERIARDAFEDDRDIKNYEDFVNSGKPSNLFIRERLLYDGLDGIIISDAGYKLIADYAASQPNAARSIVGAGGNTDGSVYGNLNSAIVAYLTQLIINHYEFKKLTLLAVPYEAKDSTNHKTIRFKIEALGYDGYDKYLDISKKLGELVPGKNVEYEDFKNYMENKPVDVPKPEENDEPKDKNGSAGDDPKGPKADDTNGKPEDKTDKIEESTEKNETEKNNDKQSESEGNVIGEKGSDEVAEEVKDEPTEEFAVEPNDAYLDETNE